MCKILWGMHWHIACDIGDLLILNFFVLFIWNSNLSGQPVVCWFAQSGSLAGTCGAEQGRLWRAFIRGKPGHLWANQRPRRTEPRPGWGQSNDRRELKRNLGQVVRQLNCQTFEWSAWVILPPGEFALLIWDPLLPPSSAVWMSLPRFPYLCTTCASVFVLKWIHLTPWINVFQKKTWFPHSQWKNNLTSHKSQVTVNIRTMKLMLLNSNFWLRVWNPLWNSLKSEIGKWWRVANGVLVPIETFLYIIRGTEEELQRIQPSNPASQHI